MVGHFNCLRPVNIMRIFAKIFAISILFSPIFGSASAEIIHQTTYSYQRGGRTVVVTKWCERLPAGTARPLSVTVPPAQEVASSQIEYAEPAPATDRVQIQRARR